MGRCRRCSWLGWLCAGAVARGGGALVRRGGLRRRAAFAGLVLVLGLGALSPAAQLVLSFQDYGPFRYEHAEGYTTLVDLPPEVRRLKIARDPPGLLRRLLREPAPFPERRIPDEPVIQSGFDVYLDHGTLIYVKDPKSRWHTRGCGGVHLREGGPREPGGSAGGPPTARAPIRSTCTAPALERLGDRCLAGGSLPTYPVDHVVTGQRARRWERGRWLHRELWRAEAALGAGG